MGQGINLDDSQIDNTPIIGQSITFGTSTNNKVQQSTILGSGLGLANVRVHETTILGTGSSFMNGNITSSVFLGNNLGIGSNNNVTRSVLIGSNSQIAANTSCATAIGSGNTVQANNSHSLGNGIVANLNNSVYLGDSTTYTARDNVTTLGNASVPGGSSSNVVGVVAVGSYGQTRRIQGVAEGLISNPPTPSTAPSFTPPWQMPQARNT